MATLLATCSIVSKSGKCLVSGVKNIRALDTAAATPNVIGARTDDTDA